MTMPTICACSHPSARHGARSRLCLDCGCRSFSLAQPPEIARYRTGPNSSMRNRDLTVFRDRLLSAAARAGHDPSLRAGSYDGDSGDLSRRRWAALCRRCGLVIVARLDAGVASLDPLSEEALEPCPGTPTFPIEPWIAAGFPALR